MIKMMIIVVFFFAFCWLPFNLLQVRVWAMTKYRPYLFNSFLDISIHIKVIGEHYQEIWSWTKINYVVFACHWLAMSHSAYNPIIYCCFNSKFRQVGHMFHLATPINGPPSPPLSLRYRDPLAITVIYIVDIYWLLYLSSFFCFVRYKLK